MIEEEKKWIAKARETISQLGNMSIERLRNEV